MRIPPYPSSAPVEVIFAYDIDQTIQIEVIDHTAGKSLGNFEVDAVANMNAAEVVAAELKMRDTEVG